MQLKAHIPYGKTSITKATGNIISRLSYLFILTIALYRLLIYPSLDTLIGVTAILCIPMVITLKKDFAACDIVALQGL